MSFLGSIFGTSPGTGANWKAQSAPLQTPTTNAQASTTYDQSQAAIQQQQQLLQALQSQNGIQNQSNVFGQLQGVANGTGPNPAQAQLAQATGNNTANQAALMAGQRGSSANTGLIARQAARQGGANQQNAAGQAATLQAQQSLGALNQLGGIAGQQVAQQQGATTGLNQSAQGEQGQILSAIQGQNQASVANTAQMNSANAQLNNTLAQQQGQIAGGLMGGVGSVLGLAAGGAVPMYAAGGGIQAPTNYPPEVKAPPTGPMSNAGRMLAGQQMGQPASSPYQAGQTIGAGVGQGIKAIGSGIGSLFNSQHADSNGGTAMGSMASEGPATMIAGMAHGGPVPALVSPGERYLPPKEVKEVAKGKKSAATAGEKIPGKPKVKGDSYANDTVKKNLSPGGIVVPNSVEQSPDHQAAAEKFVNAILLKQGLIGGKRKGGKN